MSSVEEVSFKFCQISDKKDTSSDVFAKTWLRAVVEHFNHKMYRVNNYLQKRHFTFGDDFTIEIVTSDSEKRYLDVSWPPCSLNFFHSFWMVMTVSKYVKTT